MRYILLIAIMLCTGIAQNLDFDPMQYKDREITAVRIDAPLQIDGVLNEPLYNTKANGSFIQIEPNNGAFASEDTEFWVGYDNNSIYIGAMMYDDNPDSIVAKMSRRDPQGESSDVIYIQIDSYHDRRSGFWFGINPVGSIADGTVSNDNNFNDTWDGIWYSQAKITDKGWAAELSIPFSQLRFNKASENIMGMGLVRMIHRKQEMDFFTYLSREESGFISHIATLRGIKNIKPPRRLELAPYITGNHGILKTEKDNPLYDGKDSNINIGTDIKMGIGNNLTIDATINPDFGQVEVDPSVINLTAFETFYQEKRPFFVEGASIFRFGTGGPTNHINFGTMEPVFFYSRRVGKYPTYGSDVDGDWLKIPSATSIYGASKLSGKITDSWSIGAFSALTRREYADVIVDDRESRAEVEPITSYNIFRTLKEFNGGRQGLGVIATHVIRNFDDKNMRKYLSDNSTVIGIDGWTFLNENKDWAIGAWMGYSKVNGSIEYIDDLQQNSSRYYNRPDADHVEYDPNRTSLDGFSAKASINRETGNWNFNSAIQIVSPGFENNDMGLNFRADNINKHIAIGYKWQEPGKVFQYLGMNTAYMSNHNFAGDKTNEMLFFFGFARLVNYWTFNPIIGFAPRTVSDQKLRGGPLVIEPSGMWSRYHIKSDTRKSTIFDFELEYQSEEDNSYFVHFSPGVELSLGSRLRVDIEPAIGNEFRPYQYVDSFDDETAIEMLGCRHIVSQMERKTISAELRVDYTFTPKLSLQAYVQPYMTAASYSRFKEFERPNSWNFVEYGKTDGMDITQDGDDGYKLYPNGSDNESIYLDNPDFNYKALIGSFVLRWEFRPGSTLYFVWTRNGIDENNPGDFNFKRDSKNLFQATADNIFAIKLTYWFGK